MQGYKKELDSVFDKFMVDVCTAYMKFQKPDAELLTMMSLSLTRLGRYAEALMIDRKAHEADPEDPIPLYNTACDYAMLGMKDEAIQFLIRSVRAGYDNLTWMLKDKDLDSLKETTEFKAIVQHLLEKKDSVYRN